MYKLKTKRRWSGRHASFVQEEEEGRKIERRRGNRDGEKKKTKLNFGKKKENNFDHS